MGKKLSKNCAKKLCKKLGEKIDQKPGQNIGQINRQKTVKKLGEKIEWNFWKMGEDSQAVNLPPKKGFKKLCRIISGK